MSTEAKWENGCSVLPQTRPTLSIEWAWANGESGDVATTVTQFLSTSAITTSEALGVPTFALGTVTLSPTSIASTEAFGTPTFSLGSVTITPSAIATAEAFGSATLARGSVTLSPSAIASLQAFGVTVILPGLVTITPTSIISAQAFGTAEITLLGGDLTVSPSSIASVEAFGNAVMAKGPKWTLCPSEISTKESTGGSTVWSVVVEPVSENFETPGYEEAWSEYTPGGNIYFVSTTLPNGCLLKCCYLVHNAVSWPCITIRNIGLMPIVYCRTYFMLAIDTLGPLESCALISGRLDATAEGLSWQVRLRRGPTSDKYLYLYYTSEGAPVVSATKLIIAGKWYCVEVKYDTYNNSFFFKVGGVTIDSGSLVAPTVPSTFIYLGNFLHEKPTSTSLELYFDFIRLNTVTAIGVEPGYMLPTSIASAEAFGTTTVVPSYVLLLASSALSEEAFGTALFYQPPDQTLVIEAIISEELFGTTNVVGNVDLVQPTSITTAVAFGTHTVVLGAAPLATEAMALLLCEYTSPPVVPIAQVGKDLEAGESITLTLTAVVPNNYYYQLRESIATVTPIKWLEHTLTVE